MSIDSLKSLSSVGNIYHGSPLLLSYIKNNPSSLLGGRHVIFGSHFRWVAVSFCGKWADLDIIQGTINGVPYMKEKYKGAFYKVYKDGGYVYTLPKDSFTSDIRLTSFEKYSAFIILPILNTEYISNPILELKNLGVNMLYY